ncbi:uncharacterized protein LOC127804495 [Diospyros lotus]|uniref:uncharacterized protein LOC127804495 n=1 Tax=Diospyros lotus TaxID=55363 RepID=UPI002258FABC|nr:uncharacterized protein LOC127804495 [Diospyros lotus]
MAPDKQWMNLVNDRLSETYQFGIKEFLRYATKKVGDRDIRCPCVKCNNTYSRSHGMVETHLTVYGIVQNYTFWYHHGERLGESDSKSEYGSEGEEDEVLETRGEEDIHGIMRDFFPTLNAFNKNRADFGGSSNNMKKEDPNDEAKKFYRLLIDLEQPLYEGSKSSKLSTIIKLLHIKSLGRWSNESFTMLLQILRDELLPDGSTLPNSYYEEKKIIQDLGLSYKKIDACVNNCMLYWKKDEKSNFCSICGASRWKNDNCRGEIKVGRNGKRKPVKILRYFPLKPRLQRLFMSSKIASFMRWHHDKRVDDGVMRHPADSLQWKSFDEMHENFASEPRNVRLGLASDGFQPFAHSKTSYSIWAVFLIPYNLPPWMCMKDSNFILSMLIPGPEGPGDAIDVYLQPLIEELQELWEVGVETFDASIH